jgi:O-antigen ligase
MKGAARRGHSADAQRAPRTWSKRLTPVAFFIAIALVLARATMLETLRDPFEATPGAEPVPRSFGAAASVVLDWLAFVPVILIVARAAFDAMYRLRFTVSHLLLIALALWAALSPMWANDRFAAVVGVSHFVGGVALLWAMSQLVRSWLRLRVVVAAGFGLLLVLIASGFMYRFVDLPATQQTIEKDWPRFLAQRGWEPDSFMARQFHQKVMAGEIVGFSASPNTLAALLAMLSVVAAGAAIQRIVDRDERWWPVAIAAPLPLAAVVIYFTHSKAAFVSPVLAAICLAAFAIARPMLARRHAIVFVASIVLILAASGALVGYGATHGNLVNDSLNFRWRYWVGSARLIAHHPLLGVGWNNFGDQYLAFREPIASEEIKDPHNLIVRVVAELGIVGGALLIAWLVRLWWELTRPVSEQEPIASTCTAPPALKFITWLAAAAMAVNVLCSIDFAQDVNWIFLEVLKRGLYFALIVMAMILVAFRSTQRQELDDRPAPWMLAALLVAVGIFLLHNAIDFSLFESGPMWVFMMLTGAALGTRTHLAGELARRDSEAAPRASSRATAGMALVGLALLWIAMGLVLVLPIVVAESKAQASDDAMRNNDLPRAAQLARSAYETLPFSNSDYLYRAARALPPDQGREALREAIRVNPTAGLYYRTLATIEKRSPAPNAKTLRDAFEQAIALDPNDVTLRIEYAEMLEKLGLADQARQQYRTALEKNDLLAPDEPKRLPPKKLQEVKDTMNALDVATTKP